jgi:hypothetical protein
MGCRRRIFISNIDQIFTHLILLWLRLNKNVSISNKNDWKFISLVEKTTKINQPRRVMLDDYPQFQLMPADEELWVVVP